MVPSGAPRATPLSLRPRHLPAVAECVEEEQNGAIADDPQSAQGHPNNWILGHRYERNKNATKLTPRVCRDLPPEETEKGPQTPGFEGFEDHCELLDAQGFLSRTPQAGRVTSQDRGLDDVQCLRPGCSVDCRRIGCQYLANWVSSPSIN